MRDNPVKFKRQRKQAGQVVSDAEEVAIRVAFLRVLQAPSAEAYQQALDDLARRL